MITTPIELAIDQISKRVDDLTHQINSLSSFGPKTWIPIGISLAALSISLYSARSNQKQSKAARLSAIKTNIDSCKSNIETYSMQLAPLKAKKTTTADEKRELEIKQQVLEAAIERMLNAYESGCDSFFKGEVNKQHFIDMFNTDLAQHIENFEEKFTGTFTSFENMVKYCKQYIKKPKA